MNVRFWARSRPPGASNFGLCVGANDAIDKHNLEIADCLRDNGYLIY